MTEGSPNPRRRSRQVDQDSWIKTRWPATLQGNWPFCGSWRHSRTALIAAPAFVEHGPEFVPQFDPHAVSAHDNALLNHRKRIVPGPVDHEARRELRQHEGEDDRHPVHNSGL